MLHFVLENWTRGFFLSYNHACHEYPSLPGILWIREVKGEIYIYRNYCHYQPILCHWSLSTLSWNIRKPYVLWCFQRYTKKTMAWIELMITNCVREEYFWGNRLANNNELTGSADFLLYLFHRIRLLQN